MPESVTVDRVDRQILALLRENARRPLREVASRVGLTVGPVHRRIARLEALGIIEGYTIKVNHQRITAGIEAVTELRVVGDLELEQIMEVAAQIPEIEEVLTLAGDPDALVKIRVDGIEHLQSVVNRLRAGGRVTGTKTLVVLESWSRFG